MTVEIFYDGDAMCGYSGRSGVDTLQQSEKPLYDAPEGLESDYLSGRWVPESGYTYSEDIKPVHSMKVLVQVN